MRYLTFSDSANATPRLGVLHDNQVIDVQSVTDAPSSLLDLIQRGADTWQRLAAALQRELQNNKGTRHRINEVRWHAPIPRPTKNIFCLGLNYASHAKESAQARGRDPKIPETPVFFTKAPTTVNGPFEEIPWDPRVTQQVDWEAELGVVIG